MMQAQVQKTRVVPNQSPFIINITRDDTLSSISMKMAKICQILIREIGEINESLKRVVVPTEVIEISSKVISSVNDKNPERTVQLFEILSQRIGRKSIPSKDAVQLLNQFVYAANTLLSAAKKIIQANKARKKIPAPPVSTPTKPNNPSAPPTPVNGSDGRNDTVVQRILDGISVVLTTIINSQDPSPSVQLLELVASVKEQIESKKDGIIDALKALISAIQNSPQGELSDVVLRAGLSLKELLPKLEAELAKPPTSSSDGDNTVRNVLIGGAVLYFAMRLFSKK